jgi:hypothetical protein
VSEGSKNEQKGKGGSSKQHTDGRVQTSEGRRKIVARWGCDACLGDRETASPSTQVDVSEGAKPFPEGTPSGRVSLKSSRPRQTARRAGDLSDGVGKQRFSKQLELVIATVLSKGFFLFSFSYFSFHILNLSLTYGRF